MTKLNQSMTGSNTASSWNVYIVRCADGSLYTGIAKSVDRRIEEHNHSDSGAKYTRSRRPVILAYSEPCDSRSHASKREAEIKRMTRLQKEALTFTDSKKPNKNK